MGKKILGLGLTIGGLYTGAGGFTSAFAKNLGLLGISSFLGSQQTVKVARLTDRIVPLDQEGAPLVKVWGYSRPLDNPPRLVWSSGLKEHITKKRSGGKGGPKVENLTVSTNLLYVGGIGPITRVETISLNTTKIYDYNGGDEQGATLTFADSFWSGETSKGIKIRIYPGATDDPVDTLLEVAKGVGNWTNYPGLWKIALEIPDLTLWGNGAPTVTAEIYYGRTMLPDIIEDLAALVKMDSSYFDLSALEGISVAPTAGEGFSFAARKSPAAAMKELGEQYNFVLVPEDGVLRAKLRPGSRVAVLSEDELRIKVGDGEDLPPALIKGIDELELPEVVEVVSPDPARGGAMGYSKATRGETGSSRKESVAYTASIKSGRRAGMARVRLGQRWAQDNAREGSIGIEYLHLGVGDRIGIQTADGINDYTVSKLRTQVFGALSPSLMGFDPLLYNLPALADTGGISINPPAVSGFPIFFASETTLVPTDSKFFTYPSFVMGVAPFPGDSWTGAVVNIDRKRVGESTFGEIQDFTTRDIAVIGELTASYTPGLPSDGYVNSLSCKVYGGEFVSLSSHDLAERGYNTILFQGGVASSFVTATQTGSSGGAPTYTLSDIKDGRHGSDDLIDGSLPSGTLFILLIDEEGTPSESIKWWETSKAVISIGAELQMRYYADTPAITGEQTFDFGTFEARNVEMPSPILTRAERNMSGDLVLQGIARTRRFEDNSINDQTRLGDIGAQRFSDGYKYLITLEADALSRTVTKYSTSDRGDIDFTITASELSTLFGGTPGTITGTIALYGLFGLGRTTSF